MKNLKKRPFATLDNEYVANILRQLVNQYNVLQVFFTKDSQSTFLHLMIHIEKNSDVEALQQSSWVKKVKKDHLIDVHFVYSERLQHRFAMGHPFFAFCCQPTAVLYQNEAISDLPSIAKDWKKYKKQFNTFQERFYHDHDLHQSQVQDLISEGASNSVFTAYARLIAHDLDYLEDLYSGNQLHSLGLDERINNLIEYIPEIQQYFVKNSPSKYYLTDLLAKAKEATANDEAIYKYEMYEAVGIAAQNLFHLVEKRFNILKKVIKKAALQVVPNHINEKPKDAILESAIETILNFAAVEQMYLYQKMVCGERITYYLMLIATGAGNEKLSTISQSLKSKTNGNYNYVLLSHSRCWIQQNLYHSQHFFAPIIKEENLVYSSNPYHPEFHWEIPHNPYHDDLYFYYKSTKDSAMQFFAIAYDPKENYQGLASLFSLFFLSFCRTYIFVKIYYLPNYLSSQTLWQLCLYADFDIRKYEYLIEQFWTDFFPYLDNNRTVQHRLSQLDKEKVAQMNLIVNKFMGELHQLVIEGKLLADLD